LTEGLIVGDNIVDAGMHDVTVMCFTEGCRNAGFSITVQTVEHAQVICGPCGTVLIDDVPEEGADYVSAQP
jgi:hypothetical protein